MHNNIEEAWKKRAELDTALAALLQGLSQHGLLEPHWSSSAPNSAVAPRSTAAGGRDHHPRSSPP
ncbi:MAG: DUF1501 domain-containing protein, partial [Verrucomicrobiaceae bacterium]|nr:DUF1501 domain-containing protein [Verrucomicrobiaceae bacterium]